MLGEKFFLPPGVYKAELEPGCACNHLMTTEESPVGSNNTGIGSIERMKELGPL